jgi:hypothetical protein
MFKAIQTSGVKPLARHRILQRPSLVHRCNIIQVRMARCLVGKPHNTFLHT